jgi:glycosidase
LRGGWAGFSLAAFVFVSAVCGAAEPVVWQQQSIYQIITDRFFDGDPANNNAEGNYDPRGHRGTSVHGGDFKGIEQKLDYIQALGATAIWISPVVLNVRGEFHGYAGLDFYKVALHWGTLDDLRHLVALAHSRGILVIDDVIVNHGGDLIDSAEPGYSAFRSPPGHYQLRFRDLARTYPPPFDLNATNKTLADLFHDNGLIHNYQDTRQVELGELSGLDDFKTESPFVRARMAEIYEYWINAVGFDGFRVDTVKHVEMSFWQEWCPAIRAYAATHGKRDFFMFGEVYDGSDEKCASYTGTKAGGAFALDSVLDYPLYFRTRNVFAKATGSTGQIAARYDGIQTNYQNSVQARLVTFLDNHDQPRFLSPDEANNHVERLRVALAFLYTSQGIPCLYYGTEQGFNGRTDPYDREDMFAGGFEQGPSVGDNFNMTHPLYLWVARLNNLRRLYPALASGVQSNLWSNPAGPGLLAYSRQLGKQQVLVVLNTSTREEELPRCPTSYAPETRVMNLLDEAETFVVEQGQTLSRLKVPGMTAKILIAESAKQPLDPVVTSITPPHDSTYEPHGESANAGIIPIVIQFSEPMERDAVEAALTISPTTRGSLTWSQAHDRLTFTPGEDGFKGSSLITVKIGATAKGAKSGKFLHAGFESLFTIR